MLLVVQSVLAWHALAVPRVQVNDTCVQPMEKGWCARLFVCTDDVTQESVRMYRILKHPELAPLDTSVVPHVNKVCQAHGFNLPAVHTDLQNWCALHAGMHGTKGRVPIGVDINKSLPKGWQWQDGSPT